MIDLLGFCERWHILGICFSIPTSQPFTMIPAHPSRGRGAKAQNSFRAFRMVATLTFRLWRGWELSPSSLSLWVSGELRKTKLFAGIMFSLPDNLHYSLFNEGLTYPVMADPWIDTNKATSSSSDQVTRVLWPLFSHISFLFLIFSLKFSETGHGSNTETENGLIVICSFREGESRDVWWETPSLSIKLQLPWARGEAMAVQRASN